MTGAYLRVPRDGKLQNIEVEHLTHAERYNCLRGRTEDELLRWLDCVCERLAQADILLQDLEKDGIVSKGGDNV